MVALGSIFAPTRGAHAKRSLARRAGRSERGAGIDPRQDSNCSRGELSLRARWCHCGSRHWAHVTQDVELYDLHVDSHERANIAAASSKATTISELRHLFSRMSEDNLYRISEGLD